MTNMDLKSRWDDRVGLFLIPPGEKGHTADCFGQEALHSLPDSVSFMVYAAISGRLNEVDSLRILKNITHCQFRDTGRRGLIKWYHEDRELTDGNAPFFICMGLIPLRKYFSKELGSECGSLIDGILAEVLPYFMDHCQQSSCFYPNSFLGDSVFAWLINEMCGDEKNDAFLLDILNGSVKYWTEEGWGWGEHMSDVYAMVCNYQMSMLILMSERLPEETRTSYIEALRQLLDIEDHFSGKPRVPAIRSYAFTKTPTAYPFRLAINEWAPGKSIAIGNLPPIGPILKR